MAFSWKWQTRGKMWAVLALGIALGGTAGALFGWRPSRSDEAETSAVAQQLAQLRNLRDGLRRDLDELRTALAKAAAPPGPNRRAGPTPRPEAKPADAMPPEAAADDGPSDGKLAAQARLRKAAEAALDQGEMARAVELLRQAAQQAEGLERSQVEILLEQSRQALPKAVLARLQQLIADAGNDQLQRWVASGDPPREWSRDFSDRRAAEAFRKAAVRLLPIAWHNREQPLFDRRAARNLDGPMSEAFGYMARICFFRDLALSRGQGRLDAAALKEIGDLYGAYGAERFLPALRGLLAAGVEGDAESYLQAVPLADCEDAAVRGEFDLMSCAELFEKCRRLAPESCQPIDASHSLSGRWRGKEQWQIYVDIPNGKITFVRANPQRELTMSIIKIGVDYLVGFAPKAHQGDRGTSAPGYEDPFQFEKLGPNDDVPRQLPDGPLSVAGVTLFVASPKTKTMDAYRRLQLAEPFIKQSVSGNAEAWRDLSDVKHYRLFERYRYANAQTSP